MGKIGRNDPCPCESGKKYKKCCINNNLKDVAPQFPLSLPEIKENFKFKKYLAKNNSKELLKIFALLQLTPKNQSKEFRIEDIQMTICNNLNDNSSKINYGELKSLILKEYQYNYREDPCESTFTENIMFFNGNNIVFPGMTSGSTVINQNLLNTILFYENNLSQELKKKIKEGTLFILHLFNEIAQTLNYKRNIFEDNDWGGEIFFPSEKFIIKYSNCFEFSKSKIKAICEKGKINLNVVNEFVSSFEEVRASTFDENILTIKPFVEINGNYYLVMPSCQMGCLNNFIVKTVETFGETSELIISYKKTIKNEISKYLSSIWRVKKVESDLLESESVWEFDVNKYAYVNVLAIESNNSEKRANEVIKQVKEGLRQDDTEFLALHITAPISLEHYSIAFEDIVEAKFQMAIGFFDLEQLITFWNIDKLTFWKYLRARERAFEKNMMITPSYSILTYFKWYKRNSESFFPTDENMPGYLAFDFAIQGGVIIEANQKNDKHFSYHYNNNLGYLPVIRTETYAPIYTSEEVFNGVIRMCLEKYIFPIWVSLKNPEKFIGKSFLDSILYWLNEFYGYLGNLLLPLEWLPVEIVLEFESGINEVSHEEFSSNDLSKTLFKYRIEPYTRKIYIKIPSSIFNALNRSDNHGERILMGCVIKGFSNLLEIAEYDEITEEEIENILDRYMPLGRAKMILAMSTINIQSESRFIPKVRFLQDSDISLVLENNVNWLGYSSSIPTKIVEPKDKIQLCVDLINSLIKQLRIRLRKYNSTQLLEFLMLRHESLIHEGANWSVQIPARLECFAKYSDVVNEFQEREANRVKTSLALRNLIEFVVAEPYYGEKEANDNDVDFLLALVHEIINYGTIKDLIQYGLDSPEMGLLPSGRIGVDQNFFRNTLVPYRNDTVDDEIVNFKESFDRKFRNISRSKSITEDERKELDIYHEKVNKAFLLDWGINLLKIDEVLLVLSEYCLSEEKSCVNLSEDNFRNLIEKETNLTEPEIESFISNMILKTRGKIDIPENRKDYSEIWPWRYNRKFSYIRRPILKIKNHDESYNFHWSMRHLDTASKNLQAIFYNGTMKVDSEYENINSLLAERNNIKGKEFRNDVFEWLVSNTLFDVIPHEVKISSRKYTNANKRVLKSDRNYGDIDILAFNHFTKTIYSIECKNTKQAKIMYDFHNSIENYINKQLPKHVSRDDWLKNNLFQLERIYNLTPNQYQIKSVVISSYQLPIKYIGEVSIPIYSFNEIKEKNIFS